MPVQPVQPDQAAGRGGRRARLWLIVLLVGAAVGTSIGVVAELTHGFRPHVIVRYRTAAIFGVRAGECIDSTPDGRTVHVLACARPHDAEVFATFRLTGQAWPGHQAIRQEASAGCADRLGGYMRPQLATILRQAYVYPPRQAWLAGERTVVCEVRASSGKLTGSVRKS